MNETFLDFVSGRFEEMISLAPLALPEFWWPIGITSRNGLNIDVDRMPACGICFA
jgi:hypothetical protein